MALIQCPECTRQVSDSATACPQCGYPIAGPREGPTRNPRTVIVEDQGRTTGGVFWGLFHFFITLPLALIFACGVVMVCASADADEGKAAVQLPEWEAVTPWRADYRRSR